MFFQLNTVTNRISERYRHTILAVLGFLLTPLLTLYLTWHALNWAFPLPVIDQSRHSANVVAANGEVLRQFADKHGVFRMPIEMNEVSPLYLETLLTYEDRGFYHHYGVDVLALVRALQQRIVHGRIISGGSTLTMQVARLLYSNQDHAHKRSYLGKLVQIFRALQIEQVLSKQEILALYLTYAPMGGNIEGVEAASQRYFGKSANTLNLSEAALLTVLPQRPSVYRPDRHPERAKSARNKVLKRLVDFGKLSNHDYQLLAKEPVTSTRLPIKKQVPLLSRELRKQEASASQIKTHINALLQADINNLIAQRFASVSNKLSVATIVMENATGKVIGYKGSLNIEEAESFGHVDMTNAIRSPGSTLKPFIYAQALELGLIHSQSLMLDIPTDFGDYSPMNFDRDFQGLISVTQALQRSKNIPPVYLLNKIGVENFVEKMEVLDASLRLPDHNLTVALGGGGSTLRELVMFYSALNRQGKAIKPRFSQHDSEPQYNSAQKHQREAQLMTPESAWIVKTILEGIRPPDRAIAKFSRNIAWKTGTSYGFRDAWAIGTSSDYTVGVWVGRPDGTPYVGQTGAVQAAPLLFDIFDLLPRDKLQKYKNLSSQPTSVTKVDICWPSGLNKSLVSENACLQTLPAWTINGLTPRTLRRDKDIANMHHWPNDLTLWRQSITPNTIEVVFPRDGSHIFSYSGQTLQLKASHQDKVMWYVNGKLSQDSIELAGRVGELKIAACLGLDCDEVKVIVVPQH